MSHTSKRPRTLVGRLDHFFFAKEVPFGLALVRICFPLALLVPMLPRWFHVREVFSLDGATAPLTMLYGSSIFIPELPGSAAVAIYSAMLFALLSMCVGWHTRTSTIIAGLLYWYFNMLDATGTLTKYSAIAVDAFVALSLCNSGAVWSIDAWRKRSESAIPQLPGFASGIPRVEMWPARLLQILIGVTYFGAAITKLQTPQFFTGDQLRYWIHTHVNYSHPVGEFMMQYPAMFVVSAYGTILWEILFLFLVFRPSGRPIMLTLGLLFHVGTSLILGLYVFPLICLSLYFAYLSERDVQRIAIFVRRLKRSWGWQRARKPSLAGQVNPIAAVWRDRIRLPSPMLYVVLIAAVASFGVEAEHQLDPYGLRRSEGPHGLEPIDEAVVREMVNASQRIRNKDKIFSFDVGNVMVAGILANHRETFRANEFAIAQVCMNPPHEDIWLQCNVHDHEGRIVHQEGYVVAREQTRVNFEFNLGQWPAGEYSIVLQTRGEDLSHRTITVQPDGGAVTLTSGSVSNP
ncbi:MAG: HTTM domain-containing protein [Planctomycetota bacterium]|nr:HTTM domain-containing protein [Planctomycetota bacterium]